MMKGLKDLVDQANESIEKIAAGLDAIALTPYQQLHLKEQLAVELSQSIDFNMGDMVDLAPNFLRIIQQDKYKRLFGPTKE